MSGEQATDGLDESKPASEQLDLTAGMDFDMSPEDIREVARTLEQAEAHPVEEESDERLAEYVAALKELSDATEDARKDVFGDELGTRADVGDEIGPVAKRQGSRRFVHDEDEAIQAIEDAGGDPREAMTLKASDAESQLKELGLEPEEHIGRNEYEYFRRRS